ncbi:hypothetical protein SKAU_G00191720 [Synaphobranchus kaupii]|uniref:Uncharacterized protein n=1 Tax=Synaphobranchus kaupii TaxID=118154 RepID=A0A9Q1IXC4_SYNKA|nr:hypothetical protein SKAU_G00191720 [Synaphobranchus kaupii]
MSLTSEASLPLTWACIPASEVFVGEVFREAVLAQNWEDKQSIKRSSLWQDSVCHALHVCCKSPLTSRAQECPRMLLESAWESSGLHGAEDCSASANVAGTTRPLAPGGVGGKLRAEDVCGERKPLLHFHREIRGTRLLARAREEMTNRRKIRLLASRHRSPRSAADAAPERRAAREQPTARNVRKLQ